MRPILAGICLFTFLGLPSIFAQAFGVKPGSTFGSLKPYLIEDLYTKHNVYRSLPNSLPLNWSIFPPEANPALGSYEITFSRLGIVSEIKGRSTLKRESLMGAARTIHVTLLGKYQRFGASRDDSWAAFEKAFESGPQKDGALLYENWDKFSSSAQLPAGFLSVSIDVRSSEVTKGEFDLSVVYRFDEPSSFDTKDRGL